MFEEHVLTKDTLLSKAEQGDAEAQYTLGQMYCIGEGVGQDLMKAKEWCTKAAEEGQNGATRYLNIIRMHQDINEFMVRGWETQRDFADYLYLLAGEYFTLTNGIKTKELAAEWYTKAAERGMEVAQYVLGLMYDEGDGILQNKEKAAEFYVKAAEQGHTQAQYRIGLAYVKGEGVAQDKNKAIGWLSKAADERHHDAIDLLVDIYAGKYFA